MNILRRAVSGFTALVVGTSSLLALAAPAVVHAAGQTCTWTGGGGDNKFSTAANWSDCGGAAPTNGDLLAFDVGVLSGESYVTLSNDITGLSIAGMTFAGSPSSYTGFRIDGSALTVSGSISNTIANNGDINLQFIDAPVSLSGNTTVSNVSLLGETTTAGHTLSLNSTVICGQSISKISGAGPVIVTSTSEQSGVDFTGDNSGFTGTFTANANTNVGFWTTDALGHASSLTATNARIEIGLNKSSRTVSQSLDLSGALSVSRGYGMAYPCMGGPDSDTKTYTLTLAGGLSLNGNLEYSGYFVNTVVNQPYTANSHTASVASGSNGSLTLPSGTVEAKEEKKEYNDNKPSDFVSVGNKQTAIINGTRGGVSVGYGGVLKGTGTVGSLSVKVGGVVAPGLSPGCLTSDTLSLYGEYQFELGGAEACTGYDQLKVLNEADSSNAVNFGEGSILTTSRYDDYTPKQGQVFVIIAQDGDKAVQGTFKDLPEGATFEQNGVVFKISYVGGDGNDVTLTVQNVPSTPDTGFTLVSEHPVLSTAVLFVLSGAIIALARRGNKLSSKKA